MATVTSAPTKVTALTTNGLEKLLNFSQLAHSRAQNQELTAAYRWAWIVLIGIFIVAAAVAFIYCRNRGYDGFNGRIEAVKGPFGVKIGIKLGCY